MGQLLQATCLCGYKSGQLMYGIGFSSMEDGTNYEMCYCDNCGIVESRDRRSTPVCSSCQMEIRYYRKKISQKDSDDVDGVESNYWEEKLYWHCPACKQNLLSFQFIGLWD